MTRARDNLQPSLAAEWHPRKNRGLTPDEVMSYSHRKVWWICKKGHVWEARIGSRSKGYGCPYCAGIRVCEDNCLGTINPTLAAEWHPKKNNELTPYEVMPYSNRKAWWICKKGHEWEAMVCNRNRGSGCPYCSGQRTTKHTSLAAVNPMLAKEWHPHKNNELTPQEVSSSSGRKVWWMCKKGHEWEAIVGSRNRGIGCPYCSGRLATKNTSLAAVNPTLAQEWHPSKAFLAVR
jgi:DNA-directed RNA polymerase subunit RPC12/RpoP